MTIMTPDPNNEKAYKIIDLNLFYNSNDTFRTAVGGYWETEEISEGTTVNFKTYNKDAPLFEYFHKIEINDSLEEVISEDVILQNKKLPVRVYGNSTVINDKHWRDLFLGGSFAGQQLLPIYNEELYGYHYFINSLPYSKMEAAVMEGNSTTNQIQISYDYNNYLPDYENYIRNLDSELLIPNYYVLADLHSYDYVDLDVTLDEVQLVTIVGKQVSYDMDVLKYAAIEGNGLYFNNIFNYDLAANEPYIDINSEAVKDQTYLATQYLPVDYARNPLSSSTISAIKNKFQNIIFDDASLNKLYNEENITQYSEFFPYYIKINFPLNKTEFYNAAHTPDDKETPEIISTELVDIITKNKYTTRFLKTLKEVFNDEIAGLKFDETEYGMNMNYLSSSEEDNVTHETQTTENVSLRTVDFIEMLSYNYNNYESLTDNCYYVGERNIYRDSMFDQFGSYRYMNTISVSHVLKDLADIMPNYVDVDNLKDFVYDGEGSAYRETVAYRIQKVGGNPAGDGRTQNTLQNFWLLNSTELEEFNFYDTQVKYGQDYTYHVYEYVMVMGARYKFSDLRLTRAINANNITEEGGVTFHGLQFYDPATNEAVDQLFYDESSLTTEFASLSEEKSGHPYLADFYLNYEPCLLIFEVPVFSKTLKVLDNPANSATIIPYQHMDASQKIGFGIKYDSHSKETFPTTISNADVKLKNDYLHGKDFLSSDLISKELSTVTAIGTTYVQTLESVSRPRYIEIYRTEEKPTAYTDFDNKLVTTLDLDMGDDTVYKTTFAKTTVRHRALPDQTYTIDFFDQRIRTNKKYYYLFRVLNEQRVIGQTSEIYETELINDGGYLYAVFNVLHEEDLEQDIYVEPSKKVKKIIHLQPNISQIVLDTTDVDFGQEAPTQVSNLKIGTADDLIWNKKFKLRISSKKTGKKIDLNITYKLNE